MIQEEISWPAAQRGLAVGSAENAGSSYEGCLSLLTSGVGCTTDDVFVSLNCINPTGVEREWGGRKKWESI